MKIEDKYTQHNINIIIKYCELLKDNIYKLNIAELIAIEHILYYQIMRELEHKEIIDRIDFT